MIIYDPQAGNLDIAERYYRSGLNVIPMRCDGSKSPSVKWKPYITERYPWKECRQHFVRDAELDILPKGIGIICGITSGNLEVMDFDFKCATVFPAWKADIISRFPAVSYLPTVATPKDGRHVYYRCASVEASRVHAETEPDRDGKTKVIIETRGAGGLVVAPGSPLGVHPLGKPYRLIQGDLFRIPIITPEQRAIMLTAARRFNQYTPQPKEQPEPERIVVGDIEQRTGERPGDAFNRSASWENILEPHGWTIASIRGTTIFWRKPDSTGREHHATTGYGEGDLLYVFSTSARPFAARTSYTKFAAFAELNHGGDFGKAASELSEANAVRINLLWEEHEHQ